MTGAEAARRARLHTLPTRAARELDRHRWLVLAPHPDDETLGAGALLCACAEAGHPAQVVYLTDGAASHPDSPTWPRARLAALRRREACAALNRLAGEAAPPPTFLDWPDANPYPSGSPDFDKSVACLSGLLRRHRITALATTWRHEPHCDHAAAFALARAAVGRRRGAVRLYEYVVWGWREADGSVPSPRHILPIPWAPAQAGRRRAAAAQHRSQLGGIVTDSPQAFRLAPAMVRASLGPQILFRTERV